MSDGSTASEGDEMYYEEDIYLDSPMESRPPTPAPSTSVDKGKGKATDDSGERADDSKEGGSKQEEQKEPEEDKSFKQKLKKVAGLDLDTAQQLVVLDPTPVSSLSTATKLSKALVLIQQTFAESHPEVYSSSAGPDAYYETGLPPWGPSPLPPGTTLLQGLMNNSLAVDPFPLDTYTSLLQLVSSALADVAQQPRGWPNGARESRNKAMHGLTSARARLGLEMQGWDMSGAQTTAGTSSSGPSTTDKSPSRNKPSGISGSEDRDLNELLVDNCRLTLLKLRPALLADPVPTPSSPSSSPSKSAPIGSAYINRLPAELLTVILRMARHSAEERILSEGQVDEYGVTKAPRGRRVGGRSGLDIVGSRTAAQRFAHSLALVCRKWQGPARSVAYASIHLRRKPQLSKLLDLISTTGGSLTQNIQEINAKLPMPPLDPDVVGMNSMNRRGRRIVTSYAGASWAKHDDNGMASSSKGEEAPGVLFSRLVASASSLRTLAVTIISHPYSMAFGGRPMGADFLEENILVTLSNIPTLRSLTIGQTIDFEELEAIIKGLPSLQKLRLDGGFDNFDGRGTVTSSKPHEAKLTSLVVGEGSSNYASYATSSVTDQQLAWLIEPAVDTLKELALTFLSMNNSGPFPGGGGFGLGAGGNSPAPFASALVADQITRMGGTLEKLTLRDFQNAATPTQSFQQPPHDGVFDHALNQLPRLVELTVPFHYTGPGLLDALVPSSNTLENLVFNGTPVNTSAADLANRIESSQFSNLRRLVVSGQYVGRGANGVQGWVGSEVRRLKAAAKEKNILCYLTST